MLKLDIKYELFKETGDDTEEVTETFYFNISKSEYIGLMVEHEGGLEGFIRRVTLSTDNKALWEEFKRIVLLAYGEKSEDGKRFLKSDELRANFETHAAFDALLMQMMTDEKFAARFITEILPKDFQKAIAEQELQSASVVPLPPTT